MSLHESEDDMTMQGFIVYQRMVSQVVNTHKIADSLNLVDPDVVKRCTRLQKPVPTVQVSAFFYIKLE